MTAVNDIIKSYDFFGNTECYCVGLVQEVQENGMLTCKMIKRVFQGEIEETTEEQFWTPDQGCMLMDDKFTRIEVIG